MDTKTITQAQKRAAEAREKKLSEARELLVEEYGSTPKQLLDSPEKIYEYMKPFFLGVDVEQVHVIALNRKNRLISSSIITQGTTNSSLIDPKGILRYALLADASAFILVHNHPSGDPSPSGADIKVTRAMKEASSTIGIQMIDHLICGKENCDPTHRGFYSFQDSGLL